MVDLVKKHKRGIWKGKGKNKDRISTCEFKRKGKRKVKKNEKCDVKAKLNMHFVDYEANEDLNADLKLMEAKCTWVLCKGLGLYAENDMDVIKALAKVQASKNEEYNSVKKRSKKGHKEANMC